MKNVSYTYLVKTKHKQHHQQQKEITTFTNTSALLVKNKKFNNKKYKFLQLPRYL